MGTLPPAQTLLQSSGQAAGVKVHGRLMLQTLPHLSNEERGSEKVGDPPEATQHGFPPLGPAPSALSCSSSSSREEMRRSLFSRTYGSSEGGLQGAEGPAGTLGAKLSSHL